MPTKIQLALRAYRSAGTQPSQGRSDVVVLAGRRRIVLRTGKGKVTVAGKYWTETLGQAIPTNSFTAQTPTREGNTETVQFKGKRVVTRVFTTAGEYEFTKMGDRFYRNLMRSYVVQVPVRIEGTRKDATTYTLKSHIPIERLGLTAETMPMNLSQRERDRRIKGMVEDDLPLGGVLHEVSRERWTYDAAGAWLISEESVEYNEETKKTEDTVVLQRRMRGGPSAISRFLHPEALCKEAFEDHGDMLCCPRQISAVLRLELGEVLLQLGEVERALYQTSELEERGCTPSMLLEFCKLRAIGCVILHNEAVVETLVGPSPLAFVVHENHCYLYSCIRVRKALMHRGAVPGLKLKKQQRASTTPALSEWLPWGGAIAPGHYFCEEDQLDELRAWFMNRNRHPRVLLKDSTTARALSYSCAQHLDGCVGLLMIHGLPEHCAEIGAWMERLGLSGYRGQGLAGTSLMVLKLLVRAARERVSLSGEEKAQLLEDYGHRCAHCSARGGLQMDHIARVSDSFLEQKFQPLCVECHSVKTRLESRRHEDEELSSHFELGVWRDYVLSPRSPPLVYRAKELEDLPEDLHGCMIADVRRCRRSALLHNVHRIPLFCPLDEIRERVDQELGDLCFLTKRSTSFITQLGYTGPGWHHRAQVEWLLHAGILDWSCISHTLTASSHLPPEILKAPLLQMEAAWEGVRALAKTSVNSLIGMWCLDETFAHTLRSSAHDADAPPGSLKRTFHWTEGGEGRQIHDFVTSTRLLSSTSCRPLHDLCLGVEAVRVGQMIYALRHTGCTIYQFKTDSVLFRPLKRKKPELESLKFEDLHTLRERYEPALKRTRRLDERCEMVPIPSERLVFRVEEATEEDLMKSNGSRPQRSQTLGARESKVYTLLEPARGEAHVLQGGSLWVSGCAGTGKSFFCGGIVERLRAQGVKVDCCAKTHTASSRINGCTLDHWVNRHVLNGNPSCAVLYLDEISQIDVSLLALLARLTYTDLRFIVAGDFSQYSPIGNCWRGTPIEEDAFERSALLHRLCGGQHVNLTECRRSDGVLFDFYSSLIAGGARFELPLAQALSQARALFNYEGVTRWNLVISHAKRMRLNRTLNLHYSRGHVVTRLRFTGAALGNAQQSMLLWPGLQLLGCGGSVRNQVPYTIERIDEETQQLWLEGLTKPLSFAQVKSSLRLSFAQTFASIQGTQYDEPLRLHDCAHPMFTRKCLFVGLSRSKSGALISLAN